MNRFEPRGMLSVVRRASRAATALAVAFVLAVPQTGAAFAAPRPEPGPGNAPRCAIAPDWNADARPGELVVTFAEDAPASDVDGVASNVTRQGGRVLRKDRRAPYVLARVPAGRSRKAFAAALENDPRVAAAQPNYLYSMALVPDDPDYAEQWGLPRIGAEAAWDVTDGSGVTVAVIDTGVDLTHPELASRVDTANDYDFVNGDDSAQDDHGHGTHVAGTVAAATGNASMVAGVAGGCTILPVKALNVQGLGETVDLVSGVNWAADHGADVINLSVAGGFYDGAFDAALQHVQEVDDVLVVAAVGNEHWSGGAYYPARYDGVLGVAATTASDERAYFSNYGYGIDIAAPGNDILSTTLGGGTLKLSGTSMASPHVAGVAALVRSVYPGLSQAQVAERLTATAQDLGPAGRDDEFGAGLVQADAAIAVQSDDAVPGVAIPVSPVGDSLVGTDTDDVYRVYLNAEQTFEVTLTAAGGADFDLRLLAPGAGHITSPSVIASTGPENPKHFEYVATTTGYHYLDVRAASGSGGYSLAWTRMSPPDDALPGVDVPASPVSDTLRAGTDVDDIYRIHLTAGQTITMQLTGAAGTDFDLKLFNPNVALVAYSWNAYYPEQISYTVAATGEHYIDVNNWSGTGAYTLTWAVTSPPPPAPDPVPAPVVTLPSISGHTLYTPVTPSTVYYGRGFTVSSFLKPRHKAGLYSLKYEGYRYERQSNGTYKWVRRATWYGKNYNYSTYTKCIKTGAVLKLRGKWKVRAVHTHTGYLPKYSGYRYFYVR